MTKKTEYIKPPEQSCCSGEIYCYSFTNEYNELISVTKKLLPHMLISGVIFLDWFFSAGPVTQTLLATLFTYFVTALGASLVFFFKTTNQKVLDLMMGFAAGVMIAASFWSLLNPAIELSSALGGNAWLTAAAGFILGGIFIMGSDILLSKATGINKKSGSLRRSILLTFAITMHNIPEGLP